MNKVIYMKHVNALMVMALLISTCSAVFVPTENDMKWLNSVTSNGQILVSDMNLISSAANNSDFAKTKTYSEYLKSDTETALKESEKYIVSTEIQNTKDYYETALRKFFSAASSVIEGIDTSDVSKLQNGITELQEGVRYLNLATKELPSM